jgi:hypothetical protein
MESSVKPAPRTTTTPLPLSTALPHLTTASTRPCCTHSSMAVLVGNPVPYLPYPLLPARCLAPPMSRP